MRARGNCKACGKHIELWGRPNRQYCDSLCRTIYHARQDLLAQTNFVSDKPQRACEICGCAYNPINKGDKYCTETCRLIAKTPGPLNAGRKDTFDKLDWPGRYRFRDTLTQNRLDRALARYARNKRVAALRARKHDSPKP